jgi:hypothetical protein
MAPSFAGIDRRFIASIVTIISGGHGETRSQILFSPTLEKFCDPASRFGVLAEHRSGLLVSPVRWAWGDSNSQPLRDTLLRRARIPDSATCPEKVVCQFLHGMKMLVAGASGWNRTNITGLEVRCSIH